MTPRVVAIAALAVYLFGIPWVINASLTDSGTHDPLLRARAALERPQLHRVRDQLAARAWIVPWQVETPHRRRALGRPDDRLMGEQVRRHRPAGASERPIDQG